MKSLKIYQMETTNYCNAKCSYCPHDSMTRPKGYVSPETVYKVAIHCRAIGQHYIALHHMGEPLLHVRLPDIIKIFNDYGIKNEFSTNGILLRDFGLPILEAKPTLIRIACDYFYKTKYYIEIINRFLALSESYNTKIRIHSILNNNLNVFIDGQNIVHEQKIQDNWASQVDGSSQLPDSDSCYFLDYNYVVVLWDGTIVPCCIDYNGNYPIGHINTINTINDNKCISLCNGCKKLQFAIGGEWSL